MKIKLLRKLLIFWTLFIGIGALGGSAMMLIDPSGEMWQMEPLLTGLQILPFPEIFFTNFIFSGIVLFLVNGVTQLTTAYLLLKNNKYASAWGIACSAILILWMLLQVLILWGPNIISNLYLGFGIMEMLTAILLYRKTLKM